MHVDSTGIRALAQSLDAVVGSANVLVDTKVPWMFGGSARAAALETTAQLTTDAERAIELLGADPTRATVVQGLRDVIDGAATLRKPGTDELQQLGYDAGGAVTAVRRHVLGELGGPFDSAMQALHELPRTVDPARLGELADILELRSALGHANDGSVERLVSSSALRELAGATTPDRAAIVRALQVPHLTATGQINDTAALIARARELLDVGFADLDQVDAAELDALLTATPISRAVAKQLPELAGVGGTMVQSTIARIADGAASVDERRLASGALDFARGIASPDAVQAQLVSALDVPIQDLTREQVDYAIELLGSPIGAQVPGTSTGPQTSLIAALRARRTGNGGGTTFALARELQNFRMHADGMATSPVRLRDAARELLKRPPDELTPEDWGRLTALIGANPSSADGARGLAAIDGLQSFADNMSSIARGNTSPNMTTMRYVEGWLLALDGTLDNATRMSQVATDLFGRDVNAVSTQDLGTMAAFVDLIPANSKFSGLRKAPNHSSFVDALMSRGRNNSNPDVLLQRYMEGWRLAMGGATQSTDELQRAALDAFSMDPMSLDRLGWGRVAGTLDMLPDTPLFAGPRKIDGMSSLSDMAMSVGRGNTSATVQTSRYFDGWRLRLDGTSSDPARLRQAASEVFSRDPTSLNVRDWGLVAALMDLDPQHSIIASPHKLDGFSSLTDQAISIGRNNTSPSGVTSWYFHGMRMAADGTADDSERLFATASALLDRDTTTWSRSDWAQLAALVDVDDQHLLIPLHRGIEGFSPVATLATSVARGNTSPSAKLVESLRSWLLELDPEYLAKRQAALRLSIDGGPIPAGATLAEYRALEEFGEIAASQRTSVAARLLENRTTTTPSGARTFLDDVDAVLADMDHAPEPLQPVRTSIEELVARNRSRINGATPRGAVRGYSNHPDYAELGRIRSNLAFLARATAPVQMPQPTPTMVTREVLDAERNLTEAARAGGDEILTW